jgi:hypothetical protein
MELHACVESLTIRLVCFLGASPQFNGDGNILLFLEKEAKSVVLLRRSQVLLEMFSAWYTDEAIGAMCKLGARFFLDSLGSVRIRRYCLLTKL